jgi:hypothetical protein
MASDHLSMVLGGRGIRRAGGIRIEVMLPRTRAAGVEDLGFRRASPLARWEDR